MAEPEDTAAVLAQMIELHEHMDRKPVSEDVEVAAFTVLWLECGFAVVKALGHCITPVTDYDHMRVGDECEPECGGCVVEGVSEIAAEALTKFREQVARLTA